ncbi:vitamin B12 transporter [Parasphingorhabdus marina DSM 22363]|uniref:Vitamin B12 transporter n=1 Tax=Parasphingorhabdus marina DSM 22363 TaxID=1123272 RepID=A0A1N6D0L6_9SPHN|nr:TonB-dependent receptor [Parasphingorhabdus marina]SIN64332.1 vitamin B12 transporter [Parasphingorhabdus marina DSM 22363]
MRFQSFIVCTTAIMSVQPVFAESTVDDVTDDELIVVTASRAEQPVSQTGQAITVINEDRIERTQSVAVVDLLRNVPGVTFARNGGIGTSTSVFIRGADSNQTVALIDGVKLNDPSSPGGGFNFGNLLTGNISRIEVLRGSQSVIWGSQAIGGVINMITREPTEDLAINARAEYGYRDTGQVVGNVSGRFGPVAASVGAGYYRSDGFSAFNEARGATEQDGYRNFGANGKLEISLTDSISVDLRGYYSDGRTDIDGFVFANGVFGLGDTSEVANTEEFVGYSGLNFALLDGRFRNRIAFAYTSVSRDNFNLDVQTFDALGRNERFEYQGIFDMSDMVTATFGAETETSKYRTGSGAGASNFSAAIDSIYGQLGITPVSGLTANIGLRYDDHSTFGGETTFAGDVVYSPNQGNTVFRASYGEGFRVPSLFQLFSDFGNDTLAPETSRSWDAGVTQKLVGGKIEVRATLFRRDSRNLIDFISCPVQTGICENRPSGTYDNVDRARAQGLEFGLVIRPVEALTWSLNYGLVDTEDRITGLTLPRRPKHSVNASLDYDWSFGLKTGASITHVGSQFDDGANIREVAGYVVVDLRAAMPVTDNIEIYGRVDNLLDEDYETIFRYGTPGRSAFAGVRVRY